MIEKEDLLQQAQEIFPWLIKMRERFSYLSRIWYGGI